MGSLECGNCRDFIVNSIKDGDSLCAFSAALIDPTSSDARFLYANHRMVNLTGYQAPDLVGRSLQTLFGADTETETRLHVTLGLQAGDYTEADLLCYRRGRASFWNRVTLTPIRDEENRLCLFLMSGQDITRIRRLEDALLQPGEIASRTVRSMQIVIEKTEARFQAVRQFQSVMVAHLERRWRRHHSKACGPASISLAEETPSFLDRRQSALMGGKTTRQKIFGPARSATSA